MLNRPLTAAELRRTFDGFLDAVRTGALTATCSGLHPATLDAIDEVAKSCPTVPHHLIDSARQSFERPEDTWRR
jgi:hypothetical protein